MHRVMLQWDSDWEQFSVNRTELLQLLLCLPDPMWLIRPNPYAPAGQRQEKKKKKILEEWTEGEKASIHRGLHFFLTNSASLFLYFLL